MNILTIYGADERRFAEASLYPDMQLARITSQYKDMYKVITQNGERFAEVSGNFRYKAQSASEFPTVGDFVMTNTAEEPCDNLAIHELLSRKSLFERRAAGSKNKVQPIAANIDTVFICMSLNGNYSLNRLERYLAAAYGSGADPVAVLTKADLCEDVESVQAQVKKAAPLTDVIAVSCLNGASNEAPESYLKKGKTIAFIGSSGVGKSTLINSLAEEELMKTARIGANGKGRHTTTNRQLTVLKCGCIVIDTPGMREFGVESAELSSAFSDIEELAGICRFSDCTHTSEPGCAVLQAIADGSIDARRLDSYNKLKREAKYEGLNFRQLEAAKLDAMFKDKGGMKKIRQYNRRNDKRGKN